MAQGDDNLLDYAGLTEYDTAIKDYIDDGLSEKQDTLVSGTNIKTINSQSLLGSGNITISGGSWPTGASNGDVLQAQSAAPSGAVWASPYDVLLFGMQEAADNYGDFGYVYYDYDNDEITFGDPSGSGSPTTWYGTSNTAAATAAKVVTCAGFTLTKGAIVAVLFSTANTAATPTLNVNSTGNKNIYVGGGVTNSTTNTLKWSANTLLYFMYDGTYYRYLGSQTAASIVPPEGAGTWYGTSSTAATTAAKASTIANFRLVPGAIVNITFTTANTFLGTLTLNVNSTGAKTIFVDTTTSAANPLTWAAGETLTFVYSGAYWYFLTRSGIAKDFLPLTGGTITGPLIIDDANDYGQLEFADENNSFYFENNTGISTAAEYDDGNAIWPRNIAMAAFYNAEDAQPGYAEISARDESYQDAAHVRTTTAGVIDAKGLMVLDGDLVSTGDVTDGSGNVLADKLDASDSRLATIQSTSGEIRIQTLDGLTRLVLTTGNNLRVDTRATTSDSFATVYYAGVAPVTETTVSSIITQTSTQSTNNPISGATYYLHGATAMLEVRFKPAAARSAGTSISLGTIVSGKCPHLFASGGSQNIMGRITTAGDLQVVVRTALTANTEYTLGFTYLR